MSLQIQQASGLTPVSILETNRPLANFQPNIWGDHFLSAPANSPDVNDISKHEKQKKEIKRMLTTSPNENPNQMINLIDTIQRLGISYHFQDEIKHILETMDKSFEHDNNDLYTTSLRFRLLRQHGYNISSDVFNKFKETNDGFKDSLASDVKGMLSLYEAAQFRKHGEDILEEAIDFTTNHLQLVSTDTSSPLLEQVKRALNRPLHRSLTRVEAVFYMSIYQQDPLHNDLLLSFAKFDFNILKHQHQTELCEITKWYRSLDVKKNLPFIRDRVVEGYMWTLGVYFEPEYAAARNIYTKVIFMASIIDDIYDAYGTIQELEIFTAAIERWDISAIGQLPHYMQVCYRALLDVYMEIEKHLAREGKLYGLHYAKEHVKRLARAYLSEAKWRDMKYVPTYEEYMSNAVPSTGIALLSNAALLGVLVGDTVSKEAFEWVSQLPKILQSTCIITRLMDDIVSHKFEQSREHVASGVECYMRQYDCSEEETVKVFREKISNAWKIINEELVEVKRFPKHLLELIVNHARIMDVLYKDGDSYTNPLLMKVLVVSLVM